MAVKSILHYPDPRLRRKALPVEQVDDAVRRLVDDMAETMYSAPGVGLAAIQVNEPKRVIVIDLSEERNRLQVFINPEILARDGEQTLEEGCLSVPGIYEEVTRPNRVRVRALDRDGRPFELEAEGLLATCVQHEIDHLDGKVFVDYLSRLKQSRIRKKLEKHAREQEAGAPRRGDATGRESLAAAAGRIRSKM
ncbi:MAG: peptide deformylase [Pseudomonadota bacterium]